MQNICKLSQHLALEMRQANKVLTSIPNYCHINYPDCVTNLAKPRGSVCLYRLCGDDYYHLLCQTQTLRLSRLSHKLGAA